MPLGGTRKFKVDNSPRSEPDVMVGFEDFFEVVRGLVGPVGFKWRQEEEVERAWCLARRTPGGIELGHSAFPGTGTRNRARLEKHLLSFDPGRFELQAGGIGKLVLCWLGDRGLSGGLAGRPCRWPCGGL